MGPLGNRHRRGLVAEINVTPLVDVMLVLLIIFMVTAPMMTPGVDADLPRTTAKPLRQQQQPLVITITKDGTIHLGQVRLTREQLFEQLSRQPEDKKEEPVYLRADSGVQYGLVVGAMADIRRAGFKKLGMITQPANETNRH